MQFNQSSVSSEEMTSVLEDAVKRVTAEISAKVQWKYGVIDLKKVPDHVNYSKAEKYLRSINVEITRRMFISYLKEELLPDGHEVKNSNYSYYTREQIIYFILIDMFKPILPLGKVKVLFAQILSPMIAAIGLDATFSTLCEIIVYMTGKFEEAVATAVKEENLKNTSAYLSKSAGLPSEELRDNIEHFTNLVTLCMARGALDFYKFSPAALLE
ncbi:MAG: hypothetical protein AB9880_11405 [Christensenellales bacterium]